MGYVCVHSPVTPNTAPGDRRIKDGATSSDGRKERDIGFNLDLPLTRTSVNVTLARWRSDQSHTMAVTWTLFSRAGYQAETGSQDQHQWFWTRRPRPRKLAPSITEPEAEPKRLNSPQSDNLAGSAAPAGHISMDALPLVFVVQVFRVCATRFCPSSSRHLTDNFNLRDMFPVAGFGPFPSGARDVVTADVGQTVELSCKTEYKVEIADHVLWYKQRADQAPIAIKTIGCAQTGCRATLDKGPGDNTSTLRIRDAQVDDSGVYYCYGRDNYASFARGLTLLVGDSSTNETSLLVFVPQIETNDSAPLVCQVSGLSSNVVVIYWNISGQLTEGRSDSGRIETDHSYSVRSQVLVPAGVWWGGEICTCIVQMGSADKTRTKSVSRPIPTPDHGELEHGTGEIMFIKVSSAVQCLC
ncbi:uncharacterized protein LOC116968889 [Amblyraja radiata]|uniref:uncharacterized protein LOC116968889 n=1 Tax=Amblyraja radiata TaxID=386614 RepID=UPI00140407C3|nr:uncharacterized protein LOC116968889 [Amblyraja radiata]